MSDTKDVPKISVVMSAYNAEEYLAEAVDSILSQTFGDFEFIIVDDGSSDGTLRILQDYARHDSRIRLIIHTKNKGLIHALNSGMTSSRGKYIARMDADDIALPERFKKQYEFLEKNPEVVILGTLAAYMDASGTIYGVEPFLLHDREIRTELALKNGQFRHGAVMIRGSVVREYKVLYDTTALHYEDYELWPRILEYGKGGNLPEILYYYRKSGTSITATKRPDMIAGTDSVRARERDRLVLPRLDLRGLYDAVRISRRYKPSRVTIAGTQFRTGLHWMYQAYLFSVVKLYLDKREYSSAILSGVACFVIQPARFVYAGLRAAWHIAYK